jgi:hypothetical protein
MLIFKTDKDYGVYLEEDGDDLWITVTNGYCMSFDCIVGSVADACDTKMCVEAAYNCFRQPSPLSPRLFFSLLSQSGLPRPIQRTYCPRRRE